MRWTADKPCGPCRFGAARGFSLFELVIVILIIGVLISLAMDRLLRTQVEAERASVQYVIGALESALSLQAAELVVRQGLGAIRSLENRNPMSFLEKTPVNYRGTGADDAGNMQRSAGWLFDVDKKILVYTVKNSEYFESSVEGRPRIRLRIRLIYKDGESGEARSIRGIELHSLDEYHWLKE